MESSLGREEGKARQRFIDEGKGSRDLRFEMSEVVEELEADKPIGGQFEIYAFKVSCVIKVRLVL